MPFSKNKGVHWSFDKNWKNTLTKQQLKEIKAEVIKYLKIYEDNKYNVIKKGAYILGTPQTHVGSNLDYITINRYALPIAFHVNRLGLNNVIMQDVKRGVGELYSQSLSKNKLLSSFQNAKKDIKLYIQTTTKEEFKQDVKEKLVSLSNNTKAAALRSKQITIDTAGMALGIALTLTSEAIEKNKEFILKLYMAGFISTAAIAMNTYASGTEGRNLIAEVLVGPIPLYSVQSMERSRSDRIVKYRAIGDVFLAHQKGTKDSLRVDGILVGPMRNLIIAYLLSLQQRGEERLKELEALNQDKVNISVNENIPKNKNKSTVEMYAKHETFPIITQTSIMLDMYLQTIEWNESVENGTQCIKYHLLFRKYIEPKGWEAMSPDKKDMNMYNELYNETYSVRRRKELYYDIAWKAKKMIGESFIDTWFDPVYFWLKDKYGIDIVPGEPI